MVGKALENTGVLPSNMNHQVFSSCVGILHDAGPFGLIMALTAALMSTVDTLITAVAAIIVNDVYTPHINPNANDKTCCGSPG